MERSRKNFLKKVILSLCCLCILGLGVVYGISDYMERHTVGRILSSGEAQKLDADCILVLGASVRADGTPSPMLRDRLNVGIELYHQGIAPKLLLSGDHGQAQYDEVNVMKDYAKERGVPAEDIFLDHAGFSTYESVYRARDIFEVERMVIVTQKYHQYRALYNARQLDVEAWGVAADQKQYRGQSQRNLREIAAQIKDFAQGITKPKPTYLGEAIPISGSGLKSQE